MNAWGFVGSPRESRVTFMAFASAALLARRAGKQVEQFGGGESDPHQAVGNDKSAKNAPDGEARPIEGRRRGRFVSHGAPAPACPAFPEAVQALSDFGGREKNHESHAQDARADEILNEWIAHRREI